MSVMNSESDKEMPVYANSILNPIINLEILNRNNKLLQNVQQEMMAVAMNTIPNYCYDDNNNINHSINSIPTNHLKWKRKYY